MSAPAVARRPRLGGLNSSKKPEPYVSNATKLQRAMAAAPPPKPREKYKCCTNPAPMVDDDGSVNCINCGKVHSESTIVAEVTFGETAGGAAMVEGGFINDQQRHANSMGGTMRGLGGMDSREHAVMAGRNNIESLGRTLNQRQAVIDQAISWYRLSFNHGFTRGRRMRNVAAVALYMAARRQQQNTLMLMDLSEKIQTNVWELGAIYKALLKVLGERDPGQLKGVSAMEPLMLKFCRKLEFGEDSHMVAKDACLIMRRMDRDWMVSGRSPAGICGACILLAARMNNFRRTKREVVYVVKVAETTLDHRLQEYKRTPSAALTVNQFREFGQLMKTNTLPPAIWRREEREERKQKRKARLAGLDEDDASELAGEDELDAIESEVAPRTAPTRSSKRRKSNNGPAQIMGGISEQPDTEFSQEQGQADMDADVLDGNADAMLDTVATAVAETDAIGANDPDFVLPKKRGRPPKVRTPIVVAEEDLEIEKEIEEAMEIEIANWENIFKEIAADENHEVFKRTGWTARQLTAVYMDNRNINISPDVGEEEFEDDLDVANCILSPEETRLKEAIWLTENEDWLRKKQEKDLALKLEEAKGEEKKPKQKRRHRQMGDGSLLGDTPAASAAEAAHKMLSKRAPTFSNHVNYDKLKELFGDGTAISTPSGSGLGASPAASQSQRSPPAVPVVAVGGDGEEEEGEEEYYEEEQEVEDEEDLEHQYLDDDEGFGEDYPDDY